MFKITIFIPKPAQWGFADRVSFTVPTREAGKAIVDSMEASFKPVNYELTPVTETLHETSHVMI